MQKALFLASVGAPFTIDTRPIPKPAKGQMLVKIVATGLNPLDGMMQATGFLVQPNHWPIICGWDASGLVEEIGEEVVGFKKGDRVLYQGNFDKDWRTFQEYGLTDAVTTARIPKNLSFEEAATLPGAVCTAAIGLYGKRASEHSNKRGGAGLVAPWAEGGKGNYKDEPIIVTGGAGCVGQLAIQLAKLSGFNPIITTASAHNKAYCEAAGATHVIDYHSTPYSELASVVATITSKPIKVIYDAICTPDSQVACWSLLSAGGTIVTTLRPLKDIGEPGVKDADGKFVAWVLGSVHDDDMGDAKLGKEMFAVLERMLSDGEVRPTKAEVLEGGLAGIEEGLHRLLAGKVSGAKLVTRVLETP